MEFENVRLKRFIFCSGILIKLEENEVSDWKENYVIICNYKKWNWL